MRVTPKDEPDTRPRFAVFSRFLFQDTLEPVTDKGARDKYEHEDDYHDEDTKYSQETDIDTRAFGNKED